MKCLVMHFLYIQYHREKLGAFYFHCSEKALKRVQSYFKYEMRPQMFWYLNLIRISKTVFELQKGKHDSI